MVFNDARVMSSQLLELMRVFERGEDGIFRIQPHDIALEEGEAKLEPETYSMRSPTGDRYWLPFSFHGSFTSYGWSV